MGDISKYISRLELDKHSSEPIPDSLIPIYTTACNSLLDPIREHLALPIYLTSVYRSPEHNKAVGGVSTSEHIASPDHCAIDFRADTDLENLFDWIRLFSGLPFHQVILERPTWQESPACIHISCKIGTFEREALEGLTNGKGGYYKRNVNLLQPGSCIV